jgi:hypothetical protein
MDADFSLAVAHKDNAIEVTCPQDIKLGESPGPYPSYALYPHLLQVWPTGLSSGYSSCIYLFI